MNIINEISEFILTNKECFSQKLIRWKQYKYLYEYILDSMLKDNDNFAYFSFPIVEGSQITLSGNKTSDLYTFSTPSGKYLNLEYTSEAYFEDVKLNKNST